METFYKKWLLRDRQKNSQVRQRSSNQTLQDIDDSIEAESDIFYENEQLKLMVEKGYHKRQKNFRFEDHMFYIKIVPKQTNKRLPLLSDILDFLHAGFLHLLDNIKQFYNKADNNVAYLTLFQEPMINGLNTGNKREKMAFYISILMMRR